MAQKMVKALTLDIEKNGWEKSRGFVMREVPMPVLDEKKKEGWARNRLSP